MTDTEDVLTSAMEVSSSRAAQHSSDTGPAGVWVQLPRPACLKAKASASMQLVVPAMLMPLIFMRRQASGLDHYELLWEKKEVGCACSSVSADLARVLSFHRCTAMAAALNGQQFEMSPNAKP